jgi:hypothetical protein
MATGIIAYEDNAAKPPKMLMTVTTIENTKQRRIKFLRVRNLYALL